MPLPPEGQPEQAVTNGQVNGVGAKDVKNWEEGWYLWTTKSRWASQERMDTMQLDLEQQTKWMRKKEASEKQRMLEAESAAQGYQVPSVPQRDQTVGTLKPTSQSGVTTELPKFSEFTSQSRLIPLSPLPSEIYSLMQKSYGHIFNPTSRILDSLRDSVINGTQLELAHTMWEKARAGDAFVLVKNVLETTKEKLKELGDDDDESNDN